jgi:hypothetical protein
MESLGCIGVFLNLFELLVSIAFRKSANEDISLPVDQRPYDGNAPAISSDKDMI